MVKLHNAFPPVQSKHTRHVQLTYNVCQHELVELILIKVQTEGSDDQHGTKPSARSQVKNMNCLTALLGCI